MHRKESNHKRDYNRAYYEAHRDQIRDRQRAWHQNHKEDRRRYNKEFRASHIELIKVWNKEYYSTHGNEMRQGRIEWGHKLKAEVFHRYGGAICICCGEQHIEFLSIDHSGGGGTIHRRTEGISGGVGLYQWLKNKGYPPGYRVLCANCNSSLGRFGYCPHGNVQIEKAKGIVQQPTMF